MLNPDTNPIFRRLTWRERERKTPILRFTVLTLAVLTVVGLMWLHILGYPERFFGIIPALMCMAGLFLVTIIVSVTTAVVKRETRAQSYQLLYMTNLSSLRMVWGTFQGMVVRLRLWLALLVWAGSVALTVVTVDAAAEQQRDGFAFPPLAPRQLPPPGDVAFYALVSVAVLTLVALFVVSFAVRNGFRHVDMAWGTLQASSISSVLVIVAGTISALLMVSLTSPLWFVLVGLGLAAIVLAGAALAAHWEITRLYALEAMTAAMLFFLMLWGVLTVLIAVGVQNSSGRFFLFLLFYGFSVQLLAGWLRMLRAHAIAMVLSVHNVTHVTLIFVTTIPTAPVVATREMVLLPQVTALGLGVWALFAALTVIGVLVRQFGLVALRIMWVHLLTYSLVQLVLWVVVMELVVHLQYWVLFYLLLLPLLVGYGLTVYLQRTRHEAIVALVLLLLNLLLLPLPLVANNRDPDLFGNFLYSFILWTLLSFLYTLVLHNMRRALPDVWKDPVA